MIDPDDPVLEEIEALTARTDALARRLDAMEKEVNQHKVVLEQVLPATHSLAESVKKLLGLRTRKPGLTSH